MKSVVARFTEVKKDVSNLDPDIDLEGFDINKVDTALKSVGIKLKDEIGQIRDLDQVFLELSSHWNDLDRNTQRYIATIAAGSRQQSRFISLMENYERTQELITIANDSAGRSSKQFEKYAGSVENKINKLKNTWEQFKLNLIDEKDYKKIIDYANNFLNRFTKLDKKQLASFIVLGATVGKNLILGIVQTIKNSSNLFTSLTQTLAFKGKTRIEIESNIQDIKNQIISLNPKVEELSKLMGETFKTKGLQTYESELNKVGYTLDSTRTELTFLDITSANFDKTFKQIAATGKLNGETISELSQHFKNLRNSEDTVFGSTTRLKSSLEQLNNQQIRAANFRVGGQIIGSALGTAATAAFTGTFNPEETVNMIMAQSATMGVNSFSNALTSAFGREQGTFKEAFSKAGGEMALLSIGISGATYAIKEGIKGWKEFKKWDGEIAQSTHILADNFNKAKEKIEEQTEVITEASNKVNEFNDTYEDVFKADKTLRELSNKINLTEEEQGKLNEATSTMIELMPEVITGYDKEGNAIVQINDYYREQIKLLKEKQILLQQDETVESIKGLNDIIGLGVEAESIEKRIEEQVNNNITRNGLTVSDSKGGKYELNKENFDEKVIDYLTSMIKPMEKGELSQEDANNISKIFLMALNTHTTDEEITNFQNKLLEYFPSLRNENMISASDFNYDTQTSIYSDRINAQYYKELIRYISPSMPGETAQNIKYNEDISKLIKSGKYYISSLDASYEERWAAEYNRLLLEEGLTQEELEKAKNEIQENYTKIQNAFQEYMNEELSLELNEKPLKHEDRKSLLQNLLINWAKNDDQAFERYKKEVQEKGQEVDIKEFLEETYKNNGTFTDFLKMAPEEIDKLSDEQYEVISDYYINLYNYSAKKRREIAQEFKTSPELYTLLNSQNLAVEKEEQTNVNKIKQTYGYYSKPNSGWEVQNNKTQEYKTSLLIQRTEQGLIPSYILNQINDYASEMGDNAQAFFDAWQKWFEQNYPEDKELTEDEEDKLRFFANIDPTQLSQYNINNYAAQGKEKNYWDTLDKGKEEIQKYAKNVKIQIQKFSLGDLSDIKDEYSQKMENLSGQMSKLQPMLSSDSKIITLTSKNLNDLYDFIEFANKPVDKGGLGLNLNPEDYHTGNQMTDEQIKKLKDDVNYTFAAAEDLANFIATLKDKKDKGTISILEKSILNTAESLGLMNLLRNVPKVVPDSELEGKINAIKEISSELKGLEQNYESIYQDMYENAILSANSISGLYSSAEKLNPLLSKQGLNQLDLSKILYQTADGWGANTVALEQYIKETIKGLKAKEYVNELTPEGEELLNSLKLLEIQMNIFKTENAKKELEKYSKAAEDAAKKMKELEESQKEFVKSTGSMVSNLKNAASEMIKNGKITSSTYSSLAEDIKKINERYNTGMSIENYVDAEGNFNWAKYEADLKAFILKLKEEGIEADYLTQVLNDLKDMHEELDEELEKVQEDYNKSLEEVKEKTKSVEEANKSLSEAYKDLAEKEKKVTEAQETLNEAMYGTGNKRKSTLDGMYNYEQLLDTIDSRLDSIKTNLEHIQPGDDIAALVNEYGQGVHNKKVNLEAQKQTYERNLNEIMSNLSSYSNYFTEQSGRLLVNVAALNAASMNDKIKDEIENQVQMYNDSAKKVSDIEKQIKQVEQDYLDFKNSYRDKYIALQEKVISTLKEEAQKELDAQKEKYTAMEEADNEYTDALEKAIQKQRDLRTQANEWEELATKEKKLSLLERDTSGTNAKDVLKQQEDVEKTRQNLLDKGVDNIIKNLKDLYSNQKKSRDAEIKYQEAVLNNATYIEEANAVINSWQTADDLVSWFYEHSQEVQSMTNEQLEKYNEELVEMYNNREIYMHTSMEDFINMLNTQQDEIDSTVSNVAEHLTLESERSLHAVMEEVDKAIEKARDDIQSAVSDVEEAKNKITEAIENVAKAVQELETANKNAAESAKLLADAERQKAEIAAASSNLSSGSSSSNISKSAIQQHIENITEQRGKGWTNTVYTFTDNEMEEISKALGIYMANMNGVTYWGSDLNDLKKNMGNVNATYTGAYFSNGTKVVTQFEKGGLVNYTGPAWVDGTPAQPEAFLNAQDTRNIAQFTDVLRNLYSNVSPNSTNTKPSIGDTHIEVHINIDSIASDYDVDDAVERVKRDIIAAAEQVGSNVILHQ